MTRINGNNIQLGDSFVVSIEDLGHKAKIQEALVKEQEIIVNAEQRAAEMIEQANQQAQQLIQAGEQEALSRVEAITQQAHNEGFEVGRQEGYTDITKELRDKIIAVNDFAYSNFDIKNNIVKSAHSDIIRLVIEIAQKVCSTALELDDNILKELTLQAINSLKDKEDITIIVHPEMAQKIYAISDELKELIPQLSSIKIVEDASVSPDGTIVESPMSRVDSRVRSQIGEIAERLMGKLDSTSLAEAKPPKEVIAPIEEIQQEEQAQIDPQSLGEEVIEPTQEEFIPVIEEAIELAQEEINIEQEPTEAITEEIIVPTEEIPVEIEQEIEAMVEEQAGADEFVDLVDQDIQVRTDLSVNQNNEGEQLNE